MTVADHRNEDFAVPKIVGNLSARHGDEREPRILQFLRDQRS